MKTTKICPKCSSKDVIRVEGQFQGYGPGNNIKVGFISQVKPSKYICVNCGYIEEWIDDSGDLQKIKKSSV